MGKPEHIFAPQPAPAQDDAVLRVEGLKTHFFTHGGVVRAVDGVDLQVRAGEILGLVGESGSGKSITGFSVIGLIDEPGRIVAGSLRWRGQELIGLPERELQRLRGREIAMIFQDPMMTLNPVLRIDTQMVEAIQAHERTSAAAARERALQALARVGIPSPAERLIAYPHQLSGGMRQRVAIAIALLNRPQLIIADEPTTALDVTIQAQILHEVQKLCHETGTAMVWITHDLAVVSGLADRIAVMYAGRIVETGATADVVRRPAHPYTRGLIDSIPTRATHGQLLRQIPGMTPSLLQLPPGCAFRPRCSRASEACSAAPVATEVGPGRSVRCWHPLAQEA
ncbi:ABC transporter ATP-binding protein [Melaminivora sp.]|uniref:ABC transporter ATP-binding protein n=1 Tax=Melaminivora sp. TaxID=1933032 RepID=UPI0028A7C80E|nr:ABC transporter ATP-binding protein [Melaminivora sp.]